MKTLRGISRIVVVLALVLSFAGCEMIFGIIGGNPLQDKVRLDVSVEFAPQAMFAGALKVGIIDVEIPEGGEIDDYLTDFYGTVFLDESDYQGTASTVNVVFQEVPEEGITVFALVDLNENHVYDAGEPYGVTTASLLGDTTVTIDVTADLSTWELSGTIDIGYGFSQGGNVRVLLYDRLPGTDATPVDTLDLAFSGGTLTTVSYVFADLPAGVYHVEAFLDLDGDDIYDEGEEPIGRFEDTSGNAVVVDLDSDLVEDIPLALVQSGNTLRAALGFGDETAGGIVARLYTSTDMSGEPAYEVFETYPGGPNSITATFEFVDDGDYYLFAFVDLDDDDAYDAGEVYGEYPDDGSLFNLYSDFDVSVQMNP